MNEGYFQGLLGDEVGEGVFDGERDLDLSCFG
jgi:hypothetical protein